MLDDSLQVGKNDVHLKEILISEKELQKRLEEWDVKFH